LVIGGRNFSDYYHGRGAPWNYVDLDLRINGEAARGAAGYFDRVWDSDLSLPWRSPPDPFLAGTARDAAWQMQQKLRGIQRGQKLLDAAQTHTTSAPLRLSHAMAVPADSVRYIRENVPRTDNESAWLTAVENMLTSARQEVCLSTPWMVDTPRMRAALTDCLKRGVKLHILTNGLGGCQDFVVFASHERACAKWVRAGAVVRCLPGPDSLHTKALVVDDRIGAVGTFNIDPRSERLNTESLVVIDDARFAKRLHEVMLRQAETALRFEPGAWSQAGERGAPLDRRAKRWATPLLRVLSPLFRDLL
jgi:putative cardiolipin synthase